MQIWRARRDCYFMIRKCEYIDHWRIDPTISRDKEYLEASFTEGKAYCVYDMNPMCGGYYDVILYMYGWSKPVNLILDDWEIHDYFVIDKELTEAMNTIK